MVDRVGNKPSIPGGVPFGPGHPLYDPPKEDRDTKIGDPKESSGTGSLAESLAEEILQYINQGGEYREDYDVDKDGKLSTLDSVWAGQIAKGLRDPDTLEAIPQEQQEQPASTDPMETFLNPDGTLKEEYFKTSHGANGEFPLFSIAYGRTTRFKRLCSNRGRRCRHSSGACRTRGTRFKWVRSNRRHRCRN